MKTMDRILVVIGVFTGIFVIIQMVFYYFTGSYMEEMTRVWFTYFFGECGVMGVIQTVKTISMNAEAKAKKIEADKAALTAMAAKEAGHDETGSD